MQEAVLRFIARSGWYLGIPQRDIAAALDEIVDRDWQKTQAESSGTHFAYPEVRMRHLSERALFTSSHSAR